MTTTKAADELPKTPPAKVSDEAVEAAARAMEPSAFLTFDRGYTCQNSIAERAFINSERTVKLARKKAALALTAALPHLTACVGEWRTIESAPKDETRVLLARAGVHAIHTAFFRGGVWNCGNNQFFNKPTHWMPLPAAPTPEANRG